MAKHAVGGANEVISTTALQRHTAVCAHNSGPIKFTCLANIAHYILSHYFYCHLFHYFNALAIVYYMTS